MKAEIKKCYRNLDLPFDSTKEDVELRQKVMIKKIRAKSLMDDKNYEKDIEKINFSALTILNFIDKNGIQDPEKVSFKPSLQDIYGELIVLLVMVVLCATSFFILL